MLKEDEKILILEKIKRFFFQIIDLIIFYFLYLCKKYRVLFRSFFFKKKLKFLWNKNYTERYLFFFLL